MDKLDEEIRKVQKEAADLHRRALAKELELKALQRAAALRPASGAAPDADIISEIGIDPAEDMSAPDDKEEKRGGRQPGAISRRWRAIMNDIYANEPVNIEMVVLLASGHGLELQDTSALSRMGRYIDLGYIEATGNGQFRVTAAAVKRFGLTRPKHARPG